MTLVILWFALAVPSTAAGNVVFDFDQSFGGKSPSGDAPWISAEFADLPTGSEWDVRLTISAFNLTGSEFVSNVFFNLDPSLELSKLEWNPVDVTASNPKVSTKLDSYKAGGKGGKFDLLFDFPNDKKHRLIEGEQVIFDLRLAGGDLNASSFSFFSVPKGSGGSYLTAAHVQGIGCKGGDSDWIGSTTVVPEPLSAGLFLLGGLGLAICRRKRA